SRVASGPGSLRLDDAGRNTRRRRLHVGGSAAPTRRRGIPRRHRARAAHAANRLAGAEVATNFARPRRLPVRKVGDYRTVFSSVPIGGMVIWITSPDRSVKSSGGTTPV